MAKVHFLKVSDVLTYALQVQIPQEWSGDSDALGTMYLAYIPQAQVDPLSSMIHTMSSSFYAQAGVAGQLANSVVPSFPVAAALNALSGTTTSSGAQSSVTTPTIIILSISVICFSIGTLVVIWWTVRYVRRKRETRHRRLSEFSDPNWSGGIYATHDDDRRTSFFYASDQLQAGYLGVPPEVLPPGSIGATVMQQSTHLSPQYRSHIRQMRISAPFLEYSTAEYS